LGHEFTVLFNPVSSVLFFMLLALFVAPRFERLMIVLLALISSAIMFGNLLFYRFYSDFMTLPVLMQKSNVGSGLQSSIFDLISWYDSFIFLDVVVLFYLAFIRRLPRPTFNWKGKLILIEVMILSFFVNLYVAEQLRPELLTRSFDRQIMVRSIGMVNYHIFDLVTTTKVKNKKNSAKKSDYDQAVAYFKKLNPVEVKGPLFGAAKGRNVFLISMESLQGFVIDRTYQGQELTPFLNSLKHDSSTFYFSSFYHQTGQGKTSDAEFMMDNSLHPLPSGAVYFTHAQNKYLATPSILKKLGYYSAAFHANYRSFWNRNMMYANLGYDKYFDKQYYKITPENSVGWGLKDIPFFDQSVKYWKQLPQPFYAKMLTLTNHHPFELNPKDDTLTGTTPVASASPKATNATSQQSAQEIIDKNEPDFKGIVTDYFETVHYLDSAMKEFFDQVKKAGLYDNSIFVLYGDHYGLSPNHYAALSQYLGYDIGGYENIQLQRTPFFIVAPGLKGRTIATPAGQVDVQPTILHLLGATHPYPYYVGKDLLANNPDRPVVLRDGSFITKNYVYSHDTDVCYALKTGERQVDNTACEAFMPAAEEELGTSDNIIYKDLFRFIGK
jgi:phosphoglycerol transferase MdoB-like AlkP superfamily enzyme